MTGFYITEILIILTIFVIVIFYLLTLQKTLRLVSPANRVMRPSFVWLNLIPVISLLWNVYTVMAVSKSIKNEFSSRNITKRGDGGFFIGVLASVSLCFGVIVFFIYFDSISPVFAELSSFLYPCPEDVLHFHPELIIPPLCFLVGFIFMLPYWVIIAHYDIIMTRKLNLKENYEDPGSKIFLVLDLLGLVLLALFAQLNQKALEIFRDVGYYEDQISLLLKIKPYYYVTAFILLAIFIIIKEKFIKKKSKALAIDIIVFLVLIFLFLQFVICTDIRLIPCGC